MTTKSRWTADSVPDQSGRTFVVTGANVGLGFETSKALAGKGARVVMASRNLDKAEAAAREVRLRAPGASLEVESLDLASLDSIRAFADRFAASHSRLDVLVNSAGVMATPRRVTADGFELQLGTNHLGHFALTGRLLETLLATPKSRVVMVSSSAERYGRIRFEDLMGARSYERWSAYAQSKLANVLFAYELQRRLSAAKAPTLSVAVHPGIAATQLREELRHREPSWPQRLMGHLFESISQSAARGALPQLYAATAPDVRGGDYIAPDGLFERSGDPKRSRSSRASNDEGVARRLWQVSEQLTGVTYPALASPARAQGTSHGPDFDVGAKTE